MIFAGWGNVPKKPMVSVYINSTWVHQQGGHWIVGMKRMKRPAVIREVAMWYSGRDVEEQG